MTERITQALAKVITEIESCEREVLFRWLPNRLRLIWMMG